MKLQQNTLLALYSLLEFAAAPMRQIAAAEIAATYGVSPHHLAKVLAELARSGLVQSVRGVGGGYRFTANAKRLTLMDVVALFEDALHEDSDQLQRSPAGRALGSVLGEIDEIARATLSSITLATVLRAMQRQAQSAPPSAPPPGRRARKLPAA